MNKSLSWPAQGSLFSTVLGLLPLPHLTETSLTVPSARSVMTLEVRGRHREPVDPGGSHRPLLPLLCSYRPVLFHEIKIQPQCLPLGFARVFSSQSTFPSHERAGRGGNHTPDGRPWFLQAEEVVGGACGPVSLGAPRRVPSGQSEREKCCHYCCFVTYF